MYVLTVNKFSNRIFEAKLTRRVTTAIDMLEVEHKFHTEQETMGSFDIFNDELSRVLDPYGVMFNITREYFKGGTDVIVEITIVIMNKPDNRTDIDTEQITGTVLTDLFKHLDVTTGGYGYRTVKLYAEGWHSQEIKKLTLFANQL